VATCAWYTYASTIGLLGDVVWILLPLMGTVFVLGVKHLEEMQFLQMVKDEINDENLGDNTVEKEEKNASMTQGDIELMNAISETNQITTVYIAGPLSSKIPFVSYFRMFKALYYGAKLIERGYAVIVPHTSMFMTWFTKLDYQVWLDTDFELLLKCDVVFRLKGKSPGTDAECELAERHDIPVFTDFKEFNKEVPVKWWDFCVKFYPRRKELKDELESVRQTGQ